MMILSTIQAFMGKWDFRKTLETLSIVIVMVFVGVTIFQLTQLRSQVVMLKAENTKLKDDLKHSAEQLKTLQDIQSASDKVQSEVVDKRKTTEAQQTAVIKRRERSVLSVERSASSVAEKQQEVSQINIQTVHDLRCQYWPDQCKHK